MNSDKQSPRTTTPGAPLLATHITLGDNMLGFLEDDGTLTLTKDDLTFHGYYWAHRPWTLRAGLFIGFLTAALGLLCTAEDHVIIPIFGDVMRQWSQAGSIINTWDTPEARGVVSLIGIAKLGLGVALLVLLPFLVCLTVAYLVYHSIRLRLSDRRESTEDSGHAGSVRTDSVYQTFSTAS